MIMRPTGFTSKTRFPLPSTLTPFAQSGLPFSSSETLTPINPPPEVRTFAETDGRTPIAAETFTLTAPFADTSETANVGAVVLSVKLKPSTAPSASVKLPPSATVPNSAAFSLDLDLQALWFPALSDAVAGRRPCRSLRPAQATVNRPCRRRENRSPDSVSSVCNRCATPDGCIPHYWSSPRHA